MHEPNEDAVQNLRDTILKRGWKDSAEFITHELEFVTDLVAAGLLPIAEIRKFTRYMRITIETLMQMRDGSAEDAVYYLLEAGRAFNRAVESGRNSAGPTEACELWSLAEANAWRDHLDHTCEVFETCCQSWRACLDSALSAHRELALDCIEKLERSIPLLYSARFADMEKQITAIERGVMLSGQLAAYANDMPSIQQYADALVDDPKKWAAFSEALINSKWRDSKSPRAYLARVTNRFYNWHVRPDLSGPDSQGFAHYAGRGGKISPTDALFSESISLEEIEEQTSKATLERRFTENSVQMLQEAAAEDPRLEEYIKAIIRYPGRKRADIWRTLGWGEKDAKAVDRKFRRLRQRLKEIGAGMEWREIPTPGCSPSSNVYFEVLLDGIRGSQFGVWQHKSLKQKEK